MNKTTKLFSSLILTLGMSSSIFVSGDFSNPAVAKSNIQNQQNQGISKKFDRGNHPAIADQAHDTIVYYFYLGVEKFKAGNYGAASPYFDQAIAVEPTDLFGLEARGASYYLRGNCYQALGSYRKALTDYDVALALNPQRNTQSVKSSADNYVARGKLKITKLRDKQGGLADLNDGAKLYRQVGDIDQYQNTINLINQYQ